MHHDQKSNLGAVLQGLRLDAHRGVHTLLHLPVHRAVRDQLQLKSFVRLREYSFKASHMVEYAGIFMWAET